jgi:predicted ester cyclase
MSRPTDAAQVAATSFDRVWGDGDVGAIEERYADDYRIHFMGEQDRLVGPDALGGYVSHLHGAFPDLTVTVDDRLVDDDRVMTRWSAAGTHEGEHMGLPPTSADVELSGIIVDRIDGDEIAESWVYLALPEALRQHGLAPHGAGRGE